jgi:hypothetical protein
MEIYNKYCANVHFYYVDDQCSLNEDSLSEKSHDVSVKLSVETADSHTKDSHEESANMIEESIMDWFAIKGVINGNPEDVIEQAREKQRKNKRMEINLGTLKSNNSASLMERRKNRQSNLSV